MLGGARAGRFAMSSSRQSGSMKVWNKEISYHSFLLLALALVGVYTVLTINGSLSFQLSRGYPTVTDCSEDQEVRSSSSSGSRERTRLRNIAFGLAAGSELWENRKGYIQAWWKPETMRGAVWLDKMVARSRSDNLPQLIVSEDTSRFSYTYVGRASAKRQKQQLRISRIAVEMFRLKLPDVHWFVVGDDDTVFVADNVVRVLSKYDHTKFFYIGGISETHRQNTVDNCCTANMAYGGAGYAISYALVEALEGVLDGCMERYADLYGGSSRIHACLLELGVPLTREPGFHQLDINGDASGILGAHPIAPLLSLHHLDRIEPLFPNTTRVRSVERLLEAAAVDSGGLLQQSLCYDKQRNLTIQVSWGWAVQVTRILLPPRVLQNPIRTFAGWGVPSLEDTYEFRTRPPAKDVCERPVMFFMQSLHVADSRPSGSAAGVSVSHYARVGPSSSNGCNRKDELEELQQIDVHKVPTNASWFTAPRRQCCRIVSISSKQSLQLHVSDCRKGELAAIF